MYTDGELKDSFSLSEIKVLIQLTLNLLKFVCLWNVRFTDDFLF